MLQVLKKHGVEQYDPIGAKFDPNEHNALFEVPDPSKEAGTVAVVTKVSITAIGICAR
jgi:molecular chaperone GrpE